MDFEGVGQTMCEKELIFYYKGDFFMKSEGRVPLNFYEIWRAWL